MSASVIGGPSHWRANLDELVLGLGHLQDATDQTMRLAGEATVAGGLLAGVTLMTPQGPIIGANTLAISSGLVAMRAEVEMLKTGVDYSVQAYLTAEQQITSVVDAALTPMAAVLSIVGVTTDLNMPNKVYEIALRGTTGAVWTPVERAFSGLDMMVPGSKYVIGNVVSWAWGADENLWDIPPTQRTIGMLAHSFGHFGLLNLAPYDTKNITEQPGADGWQQRDLLDGDRSTRAMELLQDYAYDHDTVTVAKLAQPDGSDAYAIIYPGTTPMGDTDGAIGFLADNAAFGATGFVESSAADSPHVETATMDILAQAGVPAGATVIPMGYSQGGAHAMNVGVGEKLKGKYNVSDVFTAAAYTGHRDSDDMNTNFIHIEHEHDKVPAFTGASNEPRLNRTTIQVAGYPDHEVDAGIFGAEHNLGLIDHQLDEALRDPSIRAATQLPLNTIDTKMGGAVAIQQFHLDRQPATPMQHPIEGLGRMDTPRADNRHNMISVRPVDQWLTGTISRL